MAQKVKRQARWVPCPGMSGPDGRFHHSMRDGCTSCAPFWEYIAFCPDHSKILTSTGYCRDCKKHFALEGSPS
jgi:hypothetical protein